MKKIISLVLVLALALATEVANADFTWTLKADMPTPRMPHPYRPLLSKQ